METVVLVLGAFFAIVGLVLFVKGAGSGGQATVNLPGGIGFSGVAPGILVFLVGAFLIYTSTQLMGGATESAGAEEAGASLLIDPPSYATIKLDDGESNLRQDGEHWVYTLGGTSAGLNVTQRPTVYLLYRELGDANPWVVQGSGSISEAGVWKAGGWIDQATFDDQNEHEFQVRAVATTQVLDENSSLDPDLSNVRGADDASSDFRYDALSEPVKLKMVKPELE